MKWGYLVTLWDGVRRPLVSARMAPGRQGVREGFLNDCSLFYSLVGQETREIWPVGGRGFPGEEEGLDCEARHNWQTWNWLLNPVSLFIKRKKTQPKSCALCQKHPWMTSLWSVLWEAHDLWGCSRHSDAGGQAGWREGRLQGLLPEGSHWPNHGCLLSPPR